MELRRVNEERLALDVIKLKENKSKIIALIESQLLNY